LRRTSVDSSFIYVGTYTEPIRFGTGKILNGKGKGVYRYAMNGSTGALELRGVSDGIRNPSYLTLHPSRRYLYAVNELKEYEGNPTGSVSAFAVDRASGGLTFLNSQPTHGTDPCYATLDPSGTHLFVANFMSGSVCVLPVRGDGMIAQASHAVQHEGSSVNPRRQAGPHAHAVSFSTDGRFVYVPDLGIDRVMIYRFNRERGTITPNTVPWFETSPGAGPRKLVFHPHEAYAYLINELDSTIMALSWGKEDGALREIQTVSTLPSEWVAAASPDSDPRSMCAEVQIFPTGAYLYGSNRGHDSIVCYRIVPETGRLQYVAHESTRGKTPRHFLIHP